MKLDIKRQLVDPLISKKIDTPPAVDIAALKDAGFYEDFIELMGEQRGVIFGKPWKLVGPIAVAIAGLGGAAWEYGSRLVESGRIQDAAELMINEAKATYKSIK